MTKLTRWVIVLGAMLALVVPLGAAADNGGGKNDRRVLFATDTDGNLLRFDSRSRGTSARSRSRACRWASRSAASTSGRPPATSTRSEATRSSTA
jgi:hypothetical protein